MSHDTATNTVELRAATKVAETRTTTCGHRKFNEWYLVASTSHKASVFLVVASGPVVRVRRQPFIMHCIM